MSSWYRPGGSPGARYGGVHGAYRPPPGSLADRGSFTVTWAFARLSYLSLHCRVFSGPSGPTLQGWSAVQARAFGAVRTHGAGTTGRSRTSDRRWFNTHDLPWRAPGQITRYRRLRG